MRIEAIIVCKDYGDFLAHTLPENLQHLDHVVVVTDHNDKATQDICNHLGVVCVKSDVWKEHGDSFNKGRMINVGMNHCRNDGFLLHLDADIVLPHRFRYVFAAAKPEDDCIYGADRLNVSCFEEWIAIKNKIVPQWKDGCHVVPLRNVELGTRLLHGDYGYCPIGYLQAWAASQNMHYPGCSGSSEHSDVMFAIQWPRVKRVLLPQMFVYHLASERAPMGANWGGRKTKAFCPCHSYIFPKNQAYQESKNAAAIKKKAGKDSDDAHLGRYEPPHPKPRPRWWPRYIPYPPPREDGLWWMIYEDYQRWWR